ncbi:MAG: phosphatidate cytidylyltransferase [Candidatus Omnitrophota bacterium]
MHLRRILTGLAFLPIFLLGIFWRHGDWVTAAAAAFAFVYAREELYILLEAKQRRESMWWQNLCGALFFVVCVYHDFSTSLIAALRLAAVFFFFWGSCLITLSHTVKGSRNEFAAHGLTMIYVLAPLACLVYLRGIENGPNYLFFLLAVTCLTDIGAFYGGTWLGRHPLAPVISPKKTWEGSICGTVFAAAAILGIAAYQSAKYGQTLWLSGPHRYMEILIVAVMMSVIAQIGDLCESAIKRDAGVKDSGRSITGHGGFLDMMDSLLWAAPAMLVYVKFFVTAAE